MRQFFIIRIMFIIIFGIISFAYPQGKGGRWQFEDNGFDTATWDQANDDGTLQNEASYSSAAPLIEGTSYLWLDSSSVHDFFKVEDSDDLDFDNENIGISAWIYPIILNDVHYFVNKGVQNTNPKTTNYALRISKAKKLEFLIRDANNQAQTVSSGFTIPVNQWTFVAVFYDFATEKVYMWNDPNLPPQDTLDFNHNFFSNSDPLVIGSWFRSDPANSSVKDFEGRIDDVRISGRVEDVVPKVTRIKEERAEKQETFDVEIFPNPVRLSRNTVRIKVQSKTINPEPLTLNIYNILGEKIFHTDFYHPAAGNDFQWNFRTSTGNKVGTGIYLLEINEKNLRSCKRIVVLK